MGLGQSPDNDAPVTDSETPITGDHIIQYCTYNVQYTYLYNIAVCAVYKVYTMYVPQYIKYPLAFGGQLL